jgi:hypothetical protein
VSLIMPHINYGNVVFSTVDSASHRDDLTLRSILVCVLFMISLVGSMFLILCRCYRYFVGDSFEDSPFDILVQGSVY